MPAKTISLDAETYRLLRQEKRTPREALSNVIRRLAQERPALTAGELVRALQPFEGKGAGRKRSRRAAA